ncbi:MAG: hypothetical protein WC742_01310 [Gallionellaceae bacterium]|jgi:hypothetical protein
MKPSQEDEMQENIRRTASVHALHKIQKIVEEERNTEAVVARVLHAFLLYGWVVLLLIAGVVAHFMGVF